MLRILSDTNDIARFDVDASDALISSGIAENGTWVVNRGGTLTLAEAGALDAMAIYTESNRDGSAGWSPDATANGSSKLTVLWGKYRAHTDQYEGNPAAGELLETNANGKLVVSSQGDNKAVAVCTVAPFAYKNVSDNQIYKDKTVIEILTL